MKWAISKGGVHSFSSNFRAAAKVSTYDFLSMGDCHLKKAPHATYTSFAQPNPQINYYYTHSHRPGASVIEFFNDDAAVSVVGSAWGAVGVGLVTPPPVALHPPIPNTTTTSTEYHHHHHSHAVIQQKPLSSNNIERGRISCHKVSHQNHHHHSHSLSSSASSMALLLSPLNHIQVPCLKVTPS